MDNFGYHKNGYFDIKLDGYKNFDAITACPMVQGSHLLRGFLPAKRTLRTVIVIRPQEDKKIPPGQLPRRGYQALQPGDGHLFPSAGSKRGGYAFLADDALTHHMIVPGRAISCPPSSGRERPHDVQHLPPSPGPAQGGFVEQQHLRSIANARAMATRCFWPPEICRGFALIYGAMPTFSR